MIIRNWQALLLPISLDEVDMSEKNRANIEHWRTQYFSASAQGVPLGGIAAKGIENEYN